MTFPGFPWPYEPCLSTRTDLHDFKRARTHNRMHFQFWKGKFLWVGRKQSPWRQPTARHVRAHTCIRKKKKLVQNTNTPRESETWIHHLQDLVLITKPTIFRETKHRACRSAFVLNTDSMSRTFSDESNRPLHISQGPARHLRRSSVIYLAWRWICQSIIPTRMTCKKNVNIFSYTRSRYNHSETTTKMSGSSSNICSSKAGLSVHI